MLHFKQLIKSLYKNRIQSLLSVLSLMISFIGIIILTVYISFEKSFDSFHVNKESVCRLETAMYGCHLPAKIKEPIQKQIVGIEDITVILFDGTKKISSPELSEQNISFSSKIISAEKSFFKLFSFPLEFGDEKTILAEPYTVVLTHSLVQKLFGNINPLGESILYNKKSYKVCGVMEDFPNNSSFKADFTYNLFHKNMATICRVREGNESQTKGLLLPKILEQISRVENGTHIFDWNRKSSPLINENPDNVILISGFLHIISFKS